MRGRAFEPDFLLMLKENDSNKVISHQVFIEPKGNQFKDSSGGFDNSKEGWKQKFLEELEEKAEIALRIEGKEFHLLGLPFYNKDLEKDFENVFKEKIN